jgi:Zn-dependent protease
MFPASGDPASFLQGLALAIPGLLLAFATHEYMHARLAVRLGDDTPERDGRLTLNPFAHFDPIGALMLVIAGFGWAKPVQVQGQYFKSPLRDMAIVAAAGPVTNFVVAALLGVILSVMRAAGLVHGPVFDPLSAMVSIGLSINVGLGVFNLLPIPPLDGSRVLVWALPARWAEAVARMEPYAPLLLLALLFTGVLGRFVYPAVAFVEGLIRWVTAW